MDNLSLRYYKKPKNQFFKRFQKKFKKLSFKSIIPILLGLLLFCGLVYHFGFSSTVLNQDIYELENSETSTYYYSEKSPFYAKVGEEYIVSHKLDNKWVVNLGIIERPQKISFGQFKNYFFTQFYNDPVKFINIEPKYKESEKFKIEAKDSYTTNFYDFKIFLPSAPSNLKVYNKEILIYSTEGNNNLCSVDISVNTTLNCKVGFGTNTTDILDIRLQDSDGVSYKLTNNRIITYQGDVNLNCTPEEVPKVGKTIVGCIPNKDVTITYEDKTINLVENRPNQLEVTTKEGANTIILSITTAAGKKTEEQLNINVNKSFYLDFAPAKEKFDLSPELNLEFIVNTNENLKLDIVSSAKESVKGYQSFNAEPIDTSFNTFIVEKKGVEFNSSSNSIIFKIDPTSTLNKDKIKVYPPLINTQFNISTTSGKKVFVECRTVLNVNDKINDKSSCKIKY